jgi:4-hydroxyphenylpyruvate dioxygenase
MIFWNLVIVSLFALTLHALHVPAGPRATHRARTLSMMNAGASSSLQGFSNFVRSNPMTDKISALRFHHVEYYCGDATTTYKRFMLGLGMRLVAKSDLSTGNKHSASYALQTGDMMMCFTAPYGDVSTVDTAGAAAATATSVANTNEEGGSSIDDALFESLQMPFPGFDRRDAAAFFSTHGLGVRAVGIEVENVQQCWEAMLAAGGISVQEPTVVVHQPDTANVASFRGGGDDTASTATATDASTHKGYAKYAEVKLYGDVVLRLVESDGTFRGAFWPNFEDVHVPLPPSLAGPHGDYGLHHFDHIVGNLFDLNSARARIAGMTGFHDFAEFVAEDVGTVDSGLNSVVLANNNEMILLPLNEPTYGTPRKSQIQTYLEQNNGEGVQHLALFSTDIFDTLTRMRAVTDIGGFEFVESQPPSYYQALRERLGDALSEEQYQQCEELGVLADKDDQGVLLQVFTKPVGDKPTLFLEIIQRVGCNIDGEESKSMLQQKPGCGGFGKGNFKDLFKSIEDYEAQLGV